MADQQKWFKFWVTAPYDDHLQRLSIADRWAWTVFGAYTKAHGTAGRVELSSSNSTLADAMGVTVADLIPCVQRLPHINVEVLENRHGENAVTIVATWRNWVKYQEDSTQAERAKRARASRSKKRGEERRREETFRNPSVSPLSGENPPVTGASHNGLGPDDQVDQEAPELGAEAAEKQLDVVPDELRDAAEVLEFLNAKTGRTYRGLANLQLIDARLREGWTVQQCRTMTMRKWRDWRDDPRMRPFARPSTLYNRAKLESYMAEIGYTPDAGARNV